MDTVFRGRADIVIDSTHPLPNGAALQVGHVTITPDTNEPQDS